MSSRRILWAVLGFLCLWALASFVSAQQSTADITLPLSIYDDKGKFVSGLAADKLRVRDSRISIQELAIDDRPRHVVLLIDMGENMTLRWPGTLYDRWQFTRQAVDLFLAHMGQKDTVSIYGFAEKQKMLVTSTGDFHMASRVLSQLPAPGTKEAKHEFGMRSSFAAALRQALSSKDEMLDWGDAIVLFSCGEVGEEDVPYSFSRQEIVVAQERSDLEKLQSPLVAAGIRVYWFTATPLNRLLGPSGLSGTIAVEQLEQAERGNLYDFVSSVGGLIFDSWGGDLQGEGHLLRPDYKIPAQKMDVARMDRAAKEAYQSIRIMYRVKLQFPAGTKRPHKIEIDVVDAQGHPDKSKRLFYSRILPSK